MADIHFGQCRTDKPIAFPHALSVRVWRAEDLPFRACPVTKKDTDMTFRKSLVIGLCAASLGGLGAPLTANAAVEVYLNSAPPPVRVEAVPTPRHGYLWVPGHWEARNHRYVWKAGYWERERKGYYYTTPRWTERNNRWYYESGHWARIGRASCRERVYGLV